MEQHLLPVWGDSRFFPAAREFGLPAGKWWDESALGYPHALISYIHWKRPFRFPETSIIFGDSGGFTLRFNGKPPKGGIDPIKVLEWQEATCTVGCLLDIPPGFGTTITIGKNAGKFTYPRRWAPALEKTVQHTERALPIYQQMRARGTKFRWYGVLHGNNEAEVRAYHDAIAKVYPFTDEGEGWAIRPEPQVDVFATARSLRVLPQLGITRAHFLAATSQKVISVLLALGPVAGMKFITYDSAYAIKSGFNRHVFRPTEDGLNFTISTEVGLDRHGRDWLFKDCPCPVCGHFRVRLPQLSAKRQAETHHERFGGLWSLWFQMHNMYVQQGIVERQAVEAAKHPEQFLRLALSTDDEVPEDGTFHQHAKLTSRGGSMYSKVMRVFEQDGHERGAIVPTGTSRSLLDFIE